MKANHGLFFGWNRPIPGREKECAELWSSFVNYFEGLKKDGKIETFIPTLLSAHGGDLNGFFFVTGDRDKLQHIRWVDEVFQELHVKANTFLTDYGCNDCYVGESLENVMNTWKKVITK